MSNTSTTLFCHICPLYHSPSNCRTLFAHCVYRTIVRKIASQNYTVDIIFIWIVLKYGSWRVTPVRSADTKLYSTDLLLFAFEYLPNIHQWNTILILWLNNGVCLLYNIWLWLTNLSLSSLILTTRTPSLPPQLQKLVLSMNSMSKIKD